MNNSQFTKLTSLANIDLIGEGVTQFLDGQLSINTNSLNKDKGKLACFCNHKGRIIALFHILSIENGVRLILPKSTMEFAKNYILKYAVFFKVKISVNTTELFALCCEQTFELEQSNRIKIEQTDLLLSFAESNFIEEDDSFWFAELMSKKIAWLGAETLEHFLPHNLNLPDLAAIDFKKGCFTGQEVIARMQYKGKLKQHLQHLQCTESIELTSNNKLFQNDKSVGEVICSVSNYGNGTGKNRTDVLALIKDSANLSKQFQTSPENSPILGITS